MKINSFKIRFDSLDNCSENTISEINSAIRYLDLAEFYPKLDQFLLNALISRDGCVALECDNTLGVLSIILGLLYRGQHLLLLPAQGNSLKEPGFKPDIPAFCRFHLTLTPDWTPRADLGSGLNLYLNEGFQPAASERLAAQCQNERLLLLRTSGSMGDAKLVCFSHSKLLENAANCIQRFALTASARVMLAVPVFHMYGLGAGLLPAFLVGANIHVLTNVNILRFLENERHFQPDVVYLNPTLIAMLLKGRRSTQPFIRSISAGAALSEELYHAYRKRFGPLTNLYGSTEMGAAATTIESSQADQPNLLLPLPGVKMQIHDGQALYCQHPYGFMGYVNRHGEPLAVPINPYNTGDVAREWDDGRIELLGRQSDSTNRAGFLVRFADIENALLRTGEIEQAVVLCSNTETWRGPKLYAFCIPVAEKTVTPHSIREACFAHLPRYAVPDEIILEHSLPCSATGKIDRRKLQQHINNIS